MQRIDAFMRRLNPVGAASIVFALLLAFACLGALCLALGFWWERRSSRARKEKSDE